VASAAAAAAAAAVVAAAGAVGVVLEHSVDVGGRRMGLVQCFLSLFECHCPRSG